MTPKASKAPIVTVLFDKSPFACCFWVEPKAFCKMWLKELQWVEIPPKKTLDITRPIVWIKPCLKSAYNLYTWLFQKTWHSAGESLCLLNVLGSHGGTSCISQVILHKSSLQSSPPVWSLIRLSQQDVNVSITAPPFFVGLLAWILYPSCLLITYVPRNRNVWRPAIHLNGLKVFNDVEFLKSRRHRNVSENRREETT